MGKGFHRPFEKLKSLKKLTADGAPPTARATPARPGAAKRVEVAAPTAAEVEAKPKEAAAGQDEAALFADEMRGVVGLPPDPRGRVIGGAAPAPSAPRRRVDDDAEAYAALADLVDGAGTFDISATDEYVEGLAPGIDKRLLRKLRAGDYAVQAHLDLHGLTSEEAHAAVDKFLVGARAEGRRCVLLIHGRGHNSKEGIPVLKERLKVWLARGRIARGVLAFCSARPSDGGAGALYVLLRK